MKRRLIACLLAACAACWPSHVLAQPASDTASKTTSLLFRGEANGTNKPVTIDADQIATWKTDMTGNIFLLRGNVLVQQERVRVRFQQGVAWIVTDAANVAHITLYVETVHLENGATVSDHASGLIELLTPSKPTIAAHQKPMEEKSMPEDPLYRRAFAQRGSLPGKPAEPVTHATQVKTVAPLDPMPTLQQVRYEDKPNNNTPAGSSTPAQTTQNPGPPPVPPLPPAGSPPAGLAPVPPSPAPPGLPGLPPVPIAPLQRYSVSPRNSTGFQIKGVSDPLDPERKTAIITGGAIVSVRNAPNVGVVDIEADRVVIWTRGVKSTDLVTTGDLPQNGEGREIEFYLAGNVEIRQQGPKDSRILRADEVYYDVNRNVAIALHSQIEFKAPPRFQIVDPIVFRADELIEHAENQYELLRAEVFSSKLPSDPGLMVVVDHGTIENRTIPKFSPFGIAVDNRQTGEQLEDQELYFRGYNVFFELEHIPFFYSPYLAGNLLNPLGPVEDISFGYNRIFGFDAGVTLNLYDLLGIQPYDGTKWRLHFDGLTARGPAVGSTFDFNGKDLYGLKGTTYDGTLTGYVIYDDGYDVLGGGRSSDLDIPVWRGRAMWRENVYDLPYGFNVQSQISYLSDRNFLEQYYWREFATDYNQETYLYVKQQQDFWAWTFLVEPRVDRDWVTEGQRLPELGGHILGLPFFDQYLTYTAHGSIGYYELRPTNDVGSPPASATDVLNNTGRFDFFQELDLPLQAGPVKFVPYALLDGTYYTNDLESNDVGRVWGGGGLRASIPFTRLYPDVQSELFNLNGINHKIVVSADYLYATTNVHHTQLPQIDQLNDNVTDQAIRDIHPYENTFLPGGPGILLSGYPLYDPQVYAIRQMIFNRVDTLDDIEELQLDVRQRWQTKRGYPGNEHVTDWMTLDVSAAYFPNTSDNFNHDFAFLTYDWLWNIGDRTALSSTAWVDPFDGGARVWTVGAYLNRPDRTNFYLGYRYIDPLNSKALTAAVSYIFSPKYAMTASATYDFGTNLAMSNSLMFTRMGSDIQVSLGVSYNALQSNFGVLFEIVPNLVPANKRPGALGALGQGGLLSH